MEITVKDPKPAFSHGCALPFTASECTTMMPMKLGFAIPIGGPWATPQNQLAIAREAEGLGYHSLWTFQRLFFPLEPQNDYPATRGQPWPEVFKRTMDPVVSLAYVAAVTERIRLGTGVLLMPYYAPIVMAKELATLDQVSGGRLDVGLGLGWSMDEYRAVGVPYRDRGKRGDEFLRCLKAIWTGEDVEFKGEFYQMPRAKVEVKPVQQPHPPILIGGYGRPVIKRVLELGDGFIGGNVPLDEVAPLAAELQAARTERSGQPIRLVSRGTVRLHASPQGPQRRPLWGSLDEIRGDIRRYAEAGLTELFLDPNFDPGIGANPDPVEAMDQARALLNAFAPRGTDV
jgi:probable F420-dependent oxidoreductase